MIRIFAIDPKTKKEIEITDDLFYFEEIGLSSFKYSDEDYRLEITIAGETEVYWIEKGVVRKAL